MKRVAIFSLPAALLLGSASPPDEPELRAPPKPGVQCDEPPYDSCLALFVAEPARPAAAVPSAGAAPAPARKPAPPPQGPRARSPVRIVVSLPLQRAYVFRDDELVLTSPVSTGRRGHETPAGTFRILQKKRHHRSNRYANAPMPYMQRLTWSGIALHAGHVPGYRASHGCIRLPASKAKTLYGLTDFATEVTVTRSRPRSADEALELI